MLLRSPFPFKPWKTAGCRFEEPTSTVMRMTFAAIEGRSHLVTSRYDACDRLFLNLPHAYRSGCTLTAPSTSGADFEFLTE